MPILMYWIHVYTQELMHTYVQDPDNTETAGKGNQALGQRTGGGAGRSPPLQTF